MLLIDKCVHVCFVKMQNLLSNNDIQNSMKLVPASTLTFDYSYLHAILQQEDELEINSNSMHLHLRALDIAITSNNFAGVFQVMLKIIEISLRVALQLKYN